MTDGAPRAGPEMFTVPTADANAKNTRLLPFIALLGLLVVAGAVRYPTLRQPLVEAHAFRQTQTAFASRIFHRSGIDLLRPQVPVLGEPWSVPFEFPLFQALATIPMNLGVETDTAMRLTSLTFFGLTAFFIWSVMLYVTRSATAAFASVAFFCFSPFSLLWSRASLIEYLATAAALGGVWAAIRWWDSRRIGWAIAAAVFSLVGMLVKPTTGAFWLLPVIGWVLSDDQGATGLGRLRRAALPGLAGIFAPGFAAAWLWTQHADAVKAATNTTRWMTSTALTEWNFGTMLQRLQLHNWITIVDRVEQLLVGRYVCIALVMAALTLAPRRWFWTGVVAALLAPIAIFFNLYVVHDYYLAAVSPAVAMLLGAGAGAVAERLGTRHLVVPAATALVVAALSIALATTSGYWRLAYRQVDLRSEGNPLPFEIADHSEEGERIVMVGLDWDPTWLYQADRRGTMIVDATKTGYRTADLMRDLRRRGYEVFVSGNPQADAIGWATTWPWVGAVSPHVYRVGEDLGAVASAAAMTTSDTSAFAAALETGRVTGSRIRIPCASGGVVPAGSGTVWLRMEAPDPNVRISIGAGLAPLPSMPVVVIPHVAGESVALACTGAEAVTVGLVVLEPPRAVR